MIIYSDQLSEIKSVNDGLSDVNAAAVQIFIDYSNQLRGAIFGNQNQPSNQDGELSGGARIMDIYSNEFTSSLQSLDARECVTVKEIRTAIVNNRGIHGGLFMSEKALEILILQCLSRFEQPCYLCVEKVKNELHNVISTIHMTEFDYFPRLRDTVVTATLHLLDEKTSITKEMIHVLLEMEKAYINTAHEDLSTDRIKKLQGGAISTARARFLKKTNPNDPPEFQEPMIQGWCYIRSSRGKYDHVYGMIKQRSFFYNATANIDRTDPGVTEVFLEGVTAAVTHNNATMGEFEFEVRVPEGETITLQVDSEAQETNWIEWFNIAGNEEVWRKTLTEIVEASKPHEEEKVEEKVETPSVDSFYYKSKIGVLEESSDWNDYSDNEQIMLEYTSRLIDTYLDTVRKNLIDSMPKVFSIILLVIYSVLHIIY